MINEDLWLLHVTALQSRGKLFLYVLALGIANSMNKRFSCHFLVWFKGDSLTQIGTQYVQITGL